MLITLKPSPIESEINIIHELLESQHIGHRLCLNSNPSQIGLEKTPPAEIIEKLQQLKSIEKITHLSTPYKLASRIAKPEKTIIQLGDIKIGGDRIVLMAGPCAIESEAQLSAIAQELLHCNVSVLRGSAYKPRTSPYSFQGMGVEGLKLHAAMQKKHKMLIETEVMDLRDVALVEQHVDILRIGARNMQNFDLLKEVGKCHKPVILKRGIASTIEEWLMSAEYILSHGNPHVILCERGIRTFEKETRYMLDISSIPIIKQLTHLPIIVDPSHAAGRKDLIPALSKAAIAAGADGLLIEVHHDPKQAKCDGNQALLPEEFKEMIASLGKIAKAVGRTL